MISIPLLRLVRDRVEQAHAVLGSSDVTVVSIRLHLECALGALDTRLLDNSEGGKVIDLPSSEALQSRSRCSHDVRSDQRERSN
jgi:hypothetical protein